MTETEPNQDRLSGVWRLILGHIVVVGAVTVPLWFVIVPPLTDYPNHITRVYIHQNISTNSILQEYYRVDWSLIPNLSLDVFLNIMAPISSLYSASVIFVAATFALWIIATSTLHYAIFGKWTSWTLVSSLFVYNACLAWGFVSFLFSAGLAILLFSLWIVTNAMPAWRRRLIFLGLSLALFLSHLIAWGIFVLLVVSYEIGRARDEDRQELSRNVVNAAINAIVVSVPFMILLRHDPSHGTLITEYGTLLRKTQALLSPVLQYIIEVDFPIFLTIVSLYSLGFVTGRVRLHRSMVFPIIVSIIVAVAMPTELFGIDYIDIRISVVLVLVFVAGCSYRIERGIERYLLVLVFASLLIWRLLSVHMVWRDYDRDYREFIAASEQIERGAHLLTAYGDGRRGQFADNLASQIGSFAVIERQVFLPNLYTGTHTLKVRPKYAHLDAPGAAPVPIGWLLAEYSHATNPGAERRRQLPGHLHDWYRNYDYLVIFLNDPDRFRPLPNLRHVMTGSYFVIYRIVEPPRAQG